MKLTNINNDYTQGSYYSCDFDNELGVFFDFVKVFLKIAQILTHGFLAVISTAVDLIHFRVLISPGTIRACLLYMGIALLCISAGFLFLVIQQVT